MTMETNSNQEADPSNSSVENSRSKAKELTKKPPGQLDPSDYEISGDNNGNEELILGDSSNFTVSERNDLFQKGLDFEKEGKRDLALKCYLSCLKGLKNKTRFALLPECLKNIADIYQAKGDYRNAIHFAQAEKLFYETALIETQEIQKKIEEVTGSLNMDGITPQDLNDLNIEALRAEEYEHLAKLCLDNKQPQLALEYAGKCAKIRQEVYGSNHVKTRETLDLFASLYAEVGKEQYSDSINTLSETLDRDNDTAVPEVVQSNNETEEPVSILRLRSIPGLTSDRHGCSESVEREKKQVRFHESVDESIQRKKREEIVSLTVTLLLLGVCFLILLALGLWLYCSIDKGQPCPALELRLRTWMRTVQYYFNRLTSTASPSTPKMEYSR